MTVRRRRDIEGFTLSFLDVISCGFGAIILLLVLSKIGEPIILEGIHQNLSSVVEQHEAELAQVRSEIRALSDTVVTETDELAQEEKKLARLQGDLSSLKGQFAASAETSAVQNTIEGKLATAKQELTEEMERLLGAAYRRDRSDRTVAGIPVDSEYIILVIDTSGSMQEYAWRALLSKVSETLQIYPVVKGIQVMNDMGDYMFSQYRGKWIPDTPARRRAIISRLKTWNAFSNSSPVEGITRAIQHFYSADKKISIYVFGDEFTGGSIDAVVAEVDRLNRKDAEGNRRVRIHAVGFPTQFAANHPQMTGIRFATLMRVLCQKNAGTFVGLNSLEPRAARRVP